MVSGHVAEKVVLRIGLPAVVIMGGLVLGVVGGHGP